MPRVIENFVDCPIDYKTLDAWLNNSEGWNQVMKIGGNEVKSNKIGAFYGIRDKHGSLPLFRCPSFERSIDMPHWMRETILAKFDERYNLIKVQKYVNGQSGINRHADKALDLVPGSDILIYRINKDLTKQRSLIFKNKVSGEEESFRLSSNSLLVITEEENKQNTHFVPEYEDDSTDECISFVIRQIGTFITPDEKIYGIGATYSTFQEREAAAGIPTPAPEELSAAILAMYRFENANDLTIHDPTKVYEEVRRLTF